MEGAFAWISAIVQWIGKWIPRWQILDSTEGGVKFEGFFLPSRLRRYKEPMRIKVCGPGLHWFWPATTSFQTYPTALQTDNLASQTMETEDGVSITVGGMVSYTIEDLGKLMPYTHSAMRLIEVTTLTAIHEVCCRMTWQRLKDEQRKGTLNTKLRNATQRQLTEYGVKVVDCMLTDLARSRVYRLIQSTQMDSGE